MAEASTGALWDDEADVIIVGMGGAGVCAAIEAAEAGASVLGLERAGAPGGASALSHGQLYMGGGTPVQKACGFEDSVEEMAKYLAAACGLGADVEKIGIFAERSVEQFDWLARHGVPFKESYLGPEVTTDPHTDDCLTYTGSELAYPFNQRAKPAPRGHTVQRDGDNAGYLMMEVLVNAAEGAGARIESDTRVRSLIQDAQGRVIGVMATVHGEEKRYRAGRGVILTAGGFINNKEMVALHAPWLRWCKARIGTDEDDGGGIRLGLEAGAASAQMDAAMTALPFSPPRSLLKGVLVNKQGQRFVNEDVYQSLAGEHSLKRQGGEVYLIVDDAHFVRPETPTQIAATADSYEVLEAELGMPKDSLAHTMRLYNENAEQGRDPLFHKDARWLEPLDSPPFAAFDLTTKKMFYAAFTLGGLRTRPSGEVLNAAGEVIPGLYAAGRTAASVPARGYSSGLSLSDALFFGRLAGAAAAVAPTQEAGPEDR